LASAHFAKCLTPVFPCFSPCQWTSRITVESLSWAELGLGSTSPIQDKGDIEISIAIFQVGKSSICPVPPLDCFRGGCGGGGGGGCGGGCCCCCF
jgi:hypothetical protein